MTYLTQAAADLLYAALSHLHDDRYALIAHDHDGLYSLLNHLHDEDYAALGHDHAGLYAALSHGHDLPYTLQGGAAAFSPADSTTYFIGQAYSVAPFTTAGNHGVYVPVSGTIKRAFVSWFAATAAGSAQQVDAYIKLGGGSSYLIGSQAHTGAKKIFGNWNMGLEVSVNSTFEIEIRCPAWTTNPTGVRLWWVVFIG